MKKADYVKRVTPNKGQQEALDLMKKFLKDKVAKEFCLNGPGGTGKTTIVKELFLKEDKKNLGNFYVPNTVIGVTVSHKARLVLHKHIHNSITYAAAVNLMIDYDEWGEMIFIPKSKEFKQSKLFQYKYIIFDECSMISEEMREILHKSCRPDAKIIYLGDDCQLPPIKNGQGDYDPDADSPTFSIQWQYTLVEKMRQDDDDHIAKLGDETRMHIKGDRALGWMSNIKTNFNKDTNKGFSWSNEASVISSFIRNYNDGKDVRIVAYRNKRIDYLNAQIRGILFPETCEERFVPGELIVGNEQYSPEEDIIFFNGEDMIVESCEISTMVDVRCHRVWIKGKDKPLYIPTDDDEGITEYNSRIAYLKKKAMKSKIWADYMDFKSQFASVSYGYAVTLYKIQGSTLHGVYVDVSDIFGVKPLTAKRKLQSFYTGVSRPTHLLAMF